MTLNDMVSARRDDFDWSTRCRQRFLGYKPCYLKRGHGGQCMSPDGVGATFENKAERVAVTDDGKLIRPGFEYALEKPRKAAALAEARARLAKVDEEIAKLAGLRKKLVAIVRKRGDCDALPSVWP